MFTASQLQNFKMDLKAVLQIAGAEGNNVDNSNFASVLHSSSCPLQVLLVLEDHQFLEVAFYEMINSLLSTGEVCMNAISKNFHLSV